MPGFAVSFDSSTHNPFYLPSTGLILYGLQAAKLDARQSPRAWDWSAPCSIHALMAVTGA
jgi:hypothetical protein